MTLGVVVLAAGKGTRFKSDLPKVLHRVAGRSLLTWVLEAVRPLQPAKVVVVVGHGAEQVGEEAEAVRVDGLVTVVQDQQRGTGHATRVALESGQLDDVDRVLVTSGDVPLLTTDALRQLVDAGDDPAVALLTAELDDPAGYGRVLRGEDGAVSAIVEHRDASEAERAVREINASVYCFDRRLLAAELAGLAADNDQGEEYLTDVVAPLVPHGVEALVVDPAVVSGVNDRRELASAGRVLRTRLLDELMRAGVTVVDPASTYVDAGVEVDPEATLLPGTHLEGATTVAAGAVVGPSCRLVDTRVGPGATVTFAVATDVVIGAGAVVGPYTHLRPGTVLGRDSKAGGFVEIKQATVGDRSKVPHLAYVGDATIGTDVNVGAGTITCNYDGFAKHHTTIGDGAFIGSDTMLVAPVEIGPGAYTGAGSTITKDVPAGDLAVERAQQRNVEGWADRFRTRKQQEGSAG